MKRRSDRWTVVRFVAQSATVGLAIAFLVVLVRPDLVNPPRERPNAPVNSYADAVAASSPAVANIYTERTLTPPGVGAGGTLRGGFLGSGVVIDREGYLVTNWHVVQGADQIRVQLADGRVAAPEIVGTDPETELALLKIDLPDLPSIELGWSDELEVGDVVLAIGNSLGLSQTVTMGIVSATGRGQLNVAVFEDFIQTDAAINIGNSGGALINSRGELVGVNTAVTSSSARNQAPPAGIGFAIPVNLVRGVMAQLIEHGRVIRGYLGTEVVDVSSREAAARGIYGPAVQLRTVTGPAESAGLRAGDILTHVAGQRVFYRQQAMNIVASTQPGERIEVRATRLDGGTITTFAVLEERPPQEGS
ncbi:S1C family serine protease [Candidatus Rariloculus sp.]|uniref:S1C family serine protease n=1 Tax=Candidatus Rariloculus sp. TaxID=3101265 RepID=UPI003D0DEA32